MVQINLQVPSNVAPGVFLFFPWSLMEVGGGAQSVAAGDIGVSIFVK